MSKIEIIKEDLVPFPFLDRSIVVTTKKFNRWLEPIFKKSFDDFVSFRPCYDTERGVLTFAAGFKQGNFTDSDNTAFVFNNVGKGSNLSGADRIMGFNNVASNGKRFSITEDAMEAFAPFMHDSVINRKDGTINWKMPGLIVQLADQQRFAMQAQQYNVINYIDPVKLLRTLFGDTAKFFSEDENGNPVVEYKPVDYKIDVIGIKPSAAPVYAPQNVLVSQPNSKIINSTLDLRLWQIDKDSISDIASDIGITYQDNLGFGN